MERVASALVGALAAAVLVLAYAGYWKLALIDAVTVMSSLSLWLNRCAAARGETYPTLPVTIGVWLPLWLEVALVRHPDPNSALSWLTAVSIGWVSLMLGDSCRALATTWRPERQRAVMTFAAPLAAALAGLVVALWSAGAR